MHHGQTPSTRVALAAFALAAITTFSFNASAGSCDDTLKGVDKALNSYKTLDLHYTMVTSEGGKSPITMKLRTRFRAKKKKKKQFTELLAPGDLKGTKVLSLSPTKMWIYMPSFRKVRRVASHTSDQSFLGTAFSAADMNLTRYSGSYSCTGGPNKLNLKARDGVRVTYGRIEMTVDKRLLPTALKYYDEGGKHVKTETREDYFCKGKVCTARRMVMVNHAKGGLSSELTLGKHAINGRISKKLFSKRNLR